MADGQKETADRKRRSLGPLRRLAPYLARYPRLVAGARADDKFIVELADVKTRRA